MALILVLILIQTIYYVRLYTKMKKTYVVNKTKLRPGVIKIGGDTIYVSTNLKQNTDLR